MRRFVEEADRGQWTLLPECLDDFIDESNPVRVIDVFVDTLDLAEMSFDGVEPAATGRPSYHPSVLRRLEADDHVPPHLFDPARVLELDVMDPAIDAVDNQVDPLAHLVPGKALGQDPTQSLLMPSGPFSSERMPDFCIEYAALGYHGERQ